ncbi:MULTISPECIES: hypothetical protein [unclassified Janthinobacterium]|uniref:hypothetical protein n=1 Tax=unclassified Janthinobacterium TaxID=2610881 RepID=UPI000374CC2E|nr:MULTISPECIES: hypothetical protein [unclassified Janthinobacterium]MEC5160253.1 hypothetical protein [Janthinobacterium sp. CG_S6]
MLDSAVPDYFGVLFFFRGVAAAPSHASAQALLICRTFFAASRFTAAVACALADPAARFAALRNTLINGFFISHLLWNE